MLVEAFNYTVPSLLNQFLCDNAIIDKTLFYDIIIHRFQVKEILNLIIVNPFASRFNNGTPPPCESWLLSDSDGYTNDNQLNIRSGFLPQTIKKMTALLRC